VASRGLGDDGSIDDLPWASVFDPAANARALSAIQAEGFRAASRIVDRFVRAVEPDSETTGSAGMSGAQTTNGNGTSPSPPPLQDFEGLTRAWWSMVGQFLLRSAPARGISPNDDEATLDLGSADAAGALNLEAPAPGSVTAEVWLHNRGPEDRGDISVRCSDLLNHEGHILSSDDVVVDPGVVPMPKRSSRGVAVTIDVSTDIRPGIYRGTLLASGHADLWLPVALTVRLPAS
jgi:hypothetical protein